MTHAVHVKQDQPHGTLPLCITNVTPHLDCEPSHPFPLQPHVAALSLALHGRQRSESGQPAPYLEHEEARISPFRRQFGAAGMASSPAVTDSVSAEDVHLRLGAGYRAAGRYAEE